MSDKSILDIQNLNVDIEGKTILHDLNLSIPPSATYVMFGPNGSGKSTLLNAVIGNPSYRVTKGSIRFQGNDITGLSIDERVRSGISMTYQNPPEVKGISLLDLFKFCLGKKPEEPLDPEHENLIDRFKLAPFLKRNINVGFSGGERKRSEVAQMLMMKSRLMLLDEPDSGVDIESLKLIAEEIRNYITVTGASVLIVTHQGEILNHIPAEKACVLMNSTIYCYADPCDIFNTIKTDGFKSCIECQGRKAETHD